MRILVVEDEHRIANSIKKGLEQEKFVVDIAYTGAEGMDLAIAENYDVIILDRMLPEMDGMEICKEIRKTGKHTPILILSARGQLQDKVEGLNLGADDYLTKPFSFEELVARVRALTRRKYNLSGNTLQVGNLKLDTIRFEVSRSDIGISLSSKEFSLLEYMMRNVGVILSKDQIISHVWNYDTDILPNTVEVYIRNLRMKIDIPFANQQQLIQTVRGFGYKIANS